MAVADILEEFSALAECMFFTIIFSSSYLFFLKLYHLQ